MPLFTVAPVSVNDNSLPKVANEHMGDFIRPKAEQGAFAHWSFLKPFKSSVDLIGGLELTQRGNTTYNKDSAHFYGNEGAAGAFTPIVENDYPVDTMLCVFKPGSGISVNIPFGTLHAASPGIGCGPYVSGGIQNSNGKDYRLVYLNARGTVHINNGTNEDWLTGKVWQNEWNVLIVSRDFTLGSERLRMQLNDNPAIDLDLAGNTYLSSLKEIAIGDGYYGPDFCRNDIAEFVYWDKMLTVEEMTAAVTAAKTRSVEAGISFYTE